MRETTDPSILTPEQKKAWAAFKRAVKQCEKANIFWYQVIDSIQPLNGHVAEVVETYIDRDRPPEDAWRIDELSECDAIMLTCSFADDPHAVICK